MPRSFKNHLKECLESVYTGEGEDKHLAMKYDVVMNQIESIQKSIVSSHSAMVVDKSSKGI